MKKMRLIRSFLSLPNGNNVNDKSARESEKYGEFNKLKWAMKMATTKANQDTTRAIQAG